MGQEFLSGYKPSRHFLQFLPEIIQEALKNIDWIYCLHYFAVTFNGTVVNFVQTVFSFAKESFEKRINLKKWIPKIGM